MRPHHWTIRGKFVTSGGGVFRSGGELMVIVVAVVVAMVIVAGFLMKIGFLDDD